jgi:hypothetical protein
VTNLKAKPFALIGVNREGIEAKKLREVMDKEKLNWRSFADQDGEIAARWNSPGTPTFYVIDHRGVIRYKWLGSPGAMAIDTALEKLITEAEGGGRKAPK